MVAWCFITAFLCIGPDCHAETNSATHSFAAGTKAYSNGEFEQAAADFHASLAAKPASGTWHNLGNAEWQLGHTGLAILAWERALWLDPFNSSAHSNLRFVRKARLLDAPELVWYEICSTWLPANVWPWVASASLWLAVAMVILPGVFRWRKAGWHQAVAAAGLAVFLLTIPALIGIYSRSRLGVVLNSNTNLRLTPTAQGQPIAHLAAGEIVHLERERGKYLFVRTANGTGWIEQAQFALIAH